MNDEWLLSAGDIRMPIPVSLLSNPDKRRNILAKTSIAK